MKRFASDGVLEQLRDAMREARSRGGIRGQMLPRSVAPLAKITISSSTDGGLLVFIDESADADPPIDPSRLGELPAAQKVAGLATQLLIRIAEEEGLLR
jgi:hypothetical protein